MVGEVGGASDADFAANGGGGFALAGSALAGGAGGGAGVPGGSALATGGGAGNSILTTGFCKLSQCPSACASYLGDSGNIFCFPLQVLLLL